MISVVQLQDAADKVKELIDGFYLIRKNKSDTDTVNLFDVKYNPFGFSFEAKESENYIIEVTQDFKLWNQLDAYSNSNGIIKFEDKRTPQVPYLKSFYRVKLLR